MIDRSEIRRLAEIEAHPAVTIYMPLETRPPETRQNAIRLGNLIRQAREELGRQGHDADAVLAGLDALSDPERPFGASESEARGAVFFCAGEDLRLFALPATVGELVAVQTGFHLAPALGMIDTETPYHAIVLDQETARLFRGTAHRFEEVEREVMEASLAEIRETTELQANVGYHPSGPVTGAEGGPPAAYRHAQGDSPDDYRQQQIEQFAHGVARAVEHALRHREGPLVAVAEPNILGSFRKYCGYPGLLDEAVTLSPADLSDEDLHRLTLEAARTARAAPREAELAELSERLGRGDATAAVDASVIAIAAEDGRVATLFLTASAVAPRPGDVSPPHPLADAAARLVLARSGEVRVVDDATIPGDSGMAALLRY